MNRPRIRSGWVAALTATLALAAVVAAPGCQTSPATGRAHVNLLNEAEEIRLGNEFAPEFLEQGGGPIPSERVQEYVSDLGHRLAAVSERPDLPWTFYTLDSAIINAFALPGGKVFISRGLLVEMDNEAQLAAVLGHEIGHVTDQHIGRQMSRGVLAQGALAVFGASVSDAEWAAVIGLGAETAAGLTLLRFSREQENTADALGIRYMTQLDYNPVGALQVMEILHRASGARGGVELFQTHPYPETRIERIERIIREDFPDYDDPARYRFHADRFKENVLDELDDLPAPTHDPRSQ